MRVFIIKSTTLDGDPARTLCGRDEEGNILIQRRYLLPAEQLESCQGYSVVRTFRGKCLVETYILLNKDTMRTMIRTMIDNGFI
jgi:hypothetical protein